MHPLVVLAVLAGLILLGSALASGTEAALLSVNPIQLHTLAKQRVGGAVALERIKTSPGRSLALLVVLNNLFNISGSLLLGVQAGHAFDRLGQSELALLLFNGGFTVAVILFGEIFPKTIGNSFAIPIALVAARPLLLLQRLMRPLLVLLERLMPSLTATAELTTNEHEIHLLARLGSQQGQIEADEAAMIGKVFALNDLTARDLMTPRVATLTLPVELGLAQAADAIVAAPAGSAWVLLGKEVDEVMGVLRREVALAALAAGPTDQPVAALAEAPDYVPEVIRADRLLTSFRRGDPSSLRVVVDEFGAFVGLISAEAIFGVLAGWKRFNLEEPD
jgi:CBS domain containing-hemolysin-like protein